MSELRAHTKVAVGSEKSFGLVFMTVFLILGAIAAFYGIGLWRAALVIAAVFGALAYLAPRLLRVPNRLWFRFGLFLHAIISPVVMFLVFAVSFVPIGLIFRLRGKDLLHRRFDPERASYWIEREQQPGSMRRQF
jgi:hypothetical protein